MSTFRGHYLPVEARREVLRIYRLRRTRGQAGEGPMPPLTAMRATVDYFSGWLAHAVAFGPVGPRQSVEGLTHQYRAAKFYLNRMYDKPEEFTSRGATWRTPVPQRRTDPWP